MLTAQYLIIEVKERIIALKLQGTEVCCAPWCVELTTRLTSRQNHFPILEAVTDVKKKKKSIGSYSKRALLAVI